MHRLPPTADLVPRAPAPTAVEAAVRTAAVQLAGLRPTRIVGEADAADARNLIDDLAALWGIVDPVVAAVGACAAENFSGIDRTLFTDQLRGALEGNATFALEEAARRIEADDGAFAADPRGHAKAVRLEVD
jgi:hypothetical protein